MQVVLYRLFPEAEPEGDFLVAVTLGKEKKYFPFPGGKFFELFRGFLIEGEQVFVLQVFYLE
jgi:hypothetical protein